MTAESALEPTDQGLVPAGDGWFVLNAREARWRHADGRSAICAFEGADEFPQVGVNVTVLAPGEHMGMYHWEADQEDFLVVAGEPILVVEGQERTLRPWDLVHCPPGTRHIIVGPRAGSAVVVAIGAREHQSGPGWGGYSVDPAAIRHGAGVERETTLPEEAYAPFPRRVPTAYREGWLPG